MIFNFFRNIFSVVGLNYVFEYIVGIFKIPTSLVLIAVNLIPLIGVFYFDWNIFNLIILYWFENLIIGFFTVFKILKAKYYEKTNIKMTLNGKHIDKFSNKSLASFFTMHYGIFTFVHGIFVFVLFFTQLNNVNIQTILVLASFVIGTFISHGISYLFNFILRKEYLYVTPQRYFTAPYKRIFPIHITIIIGGMLLGNQASNIYITLIFVGLKIFFDLGGHIFSHKSIQEKSNQ